MYFFIKPIPFSKNEAMVQKKQPFLQAFRKKSIQLSALLTTTYVNILIDTKYIYLALKEVDYFTF